MGIIWAHTGAIGCVGLKRKTFDLVAKYYYDF